LRINKRTGIDQQIFEPRLYELLENYMKRRDPSFSINKLIEQVKTILDQNEIEDE